MTVSKHLMQATRAALSAYFRNGESTAPQPQVEMPQHLMQAGPALEEELYTVFVSRHPYPLNVMLVGPPGCGKTYALKKIGRRLKKEGRIKEFLIINGNPDLTPDKLFDPTLTIVRDAQGFVEFIEAVICKYVDKSKIRAVSEVDSLQECFKLWQPEDFILIVLDEASRCPASLFAAFMLPMSDMQYNIGGKAYYLPIILALGANPPNFDQTCSVFSPATLDRIVYRWDVLAADIDVATDVISMPVVVACGGADGNRVERNGSPKRNGKGRSQRPPRRVRVHRDLVRMTNLISKLCWGLPTSRKGLAYLTHKDKQLMEAVAKAEPAIAHEMEHLGLLVDYGPNGRAVQNWLRIAMCFAERAANGHMVRLAPEHLLATVMGCLGHGGKDRFSEGTQPQKRTEKLDAIYRIAWQCFHSEKVWALVLDEPHVSVVETVGPKLFADENRHRNIELLETNLKQVSDDLRSCRHPDPAQRERALSRFLRTAGRLDGDHDYERAVPWIAGDPDVPYVCDDQVLDTTPILDDHGRFHTEAERSFFARLASLQPLSPLGSALAGLTRSYGTNAERGLSLKEQIRLQALARSVVRMVDDDLRSFFNKSPWLIDEVAEVCTLVAGVFDGEETDPRAGEPAPPKDRNCDTWWNPATPDPHLIQATLRQMDDAGFLENPTKRCFQGLFRTLARRTVRPFSLRLRELAARLEQEDTNEQP
jgi:hypothetical protein